MKQSWVRLAAAVLCLTVAIRPSAINGQDVVDEAKITRGFQTSGSLHKSCISFLIL